VRVRAPWPSRASRPRVSRVRGPRSKTCLAHASRLAHGPRQAALTPAPARMNRITPFLCTRRTMASSAGMDNRRWPRSAKRAADASMHRGTSDILDQIFCPPAPGNAHRHRVTRLAGCSSDQAATYGGACIMHCMSDPCETNCSRCSRHRSGALSAHTVSISSIIAHLCQARLAPPPHANIAPLDFWHPTLRTCRNVSQCSDHHATSGSNDLGLSAQLRGVRMPMQVIVSGWPMGLPQALQPVSNDVVVSVEDDVWEPVATHDLQDVFD
jgi:hypothetical protein